MTGVQTCALPILLRKGKNEGKGFAISSDEEDGGKYSSQVIAPIVSEGDPIGSVIIFSKEPDVTMGELESKLAETAAGFLGKQMEQ